MGKFAAGCQGTDAAVWHYYKGKSEKNIPPFSVTKYATFYCFFSYFPLRRASQKGMMKVERKRGNPMKLFLYRLWQCTWGFPQTILGLLEFIKHRKELHYSYRGAVVTECENNLNISLGLFVFVTAEKDNAKTPRLQRVLDHEYGHTIQSLLLGPLYLIVIGIPSWLWCNVPYFRNMRKKKNISYHSFYTEKWADNWGNVKDRK